MVECTIIILGITGDLACHKLIPAIHALLRSKKISRCLLVGVAPEDTSMTHILDRARKANAIPDDASWREMQRLSSFVRLDVRDETKFAQLRVHVDRLEHDFGLCGNRMLYCATPSELFCTITRVGNESGLIVKKPEDALTWHRIVYEKPFGSDYASAQAINACIAQRLDEQQIFRIDHYLSEELVSGISTLRFTNRVFEPLWSNKHVEQLHICLDEAIGIEGRGDYFDRYGTLKDVVQNHVLELLALVTMEAPSMLSGEYIRQERVRVLQKTQIVGGVLGQYATYLQEKGVAAGSRTETFALLKLMIDNERWHGVPIFVRAGKCLQRKETVVRVVFKKVACPLERPCPKEKNQLTIRIKPDPTVSLLLNVKNPTDAQSAVPVSLDFCHNCFFKEDSVPAYEKLLSAVVQGERALSMRSDEIECAWRVVDAMQGVDCGPHVYACGTMGPKEALAFASAEGIEW